MMSIKAGRPLIDLVVNSYRADIPVLLVGRHGIGKSEMLPQAAWELGIGCLVRDLSLMEAPDLLGLPQRKGDRTYYAPPSFLPHSGKGLLVLEELNRAPAYVRAPTLQLLTARTLNDYRLPAGWLPVAAVNPTDEEYEVDVLDAAHLSRFLKVTVVPDRELWLNWAKRSEIHAGVIGYVEADPHIFDHPDSNPRAWTYVSQFLLRNPNVSAHTLQAGVSGLVGTKRAGGFLSFLRTMTRPLSGEDIFNDYPRLRRQVKEWIQAGKLELVQTTLLAVLSQLQARHLFESLKRKRKRWSNFKHFVSDLPGDFQEKVAQFFEERSYPKLGREEGKP